MASETNLLTRHLDIGCGKTPRNPYSRDLLFGIDLYDLSCPDGAETFSYKKADVCSERIPFDSNYFDSLSAFDFLEHVPRQQVINGSSVFPFVILMNEIYRVLKPGGLFIASTPAYPNEKVFQDPTHVNVITAGTHEYFVGPEPFARCYGFTGSFTLKRAGWDAQKNAWNPRENPWRRWFRNVEYRFLKKGLSHVTWEFVVRKP